MSTKLVINDTYYDEGTTYEVARVLESVRRDKTRVILRYGDPETGRDWGDEWGIEGYVSRSTGTRKIPILVHNTRALGGGAILTAKILKISTSRGGHVLYQHPKYSAPRVEIVPGDLQEYPYNTLVDGELYGRHHSLRAAENTKRKLSGK